MTIDPMQRSNFFSSPLSSLQQFSNQVWGILDDESNYTQLGIKPKDICPKRK